MLPESNAAVAFLLPACSPDATCCFQERRRRRPLHSPVSDPELLKAGESMFEMTRGAARGE